MLIILEGPDGAGKSTFAGQLVRALAVKEPSSTIELLHRGPPDPDTHPLTEYVEPLLDYRPGQGRHIICDRWHLGEWVYPHALGRPSKMDRAVFRYVDLFLVSRGALTVIIDPGVDLLQQRIAHRGDEYVRVTQLPLIREWFTLEKLPRVSNCVRYHGTPTVDAVLAQARGCETRATHLNPWLTPVGSARPDVLLFGDVRACVGLGCDHARVHATSGPAFMPYPATSGHYLMRALDRVSYGSLTLANACDVDDPRSLYVALGAPATVALGRKAHKVLRSQDVPHSSVPHPQYVRRFHHAAVRDYGDLIEDVIGRDKDALSWLPSSPKRPAASST